MPQNIDPNEAAKDAVICRLLGRIFCNWQVGFPIPSPSLLVYEFSELATHVGHLTENLPSDTPIPNPNREEGAKAYLMVKRNMRQAGFLWCDADGEPVDKKYIQIDEGLDIPYLKGQLADMDNILERRLVAKWKEDVNIATLRRAIRRVLAAEPPERPVVHDDDCL